MTGPEHFTTADNLLHDATADLDVDPARLAAVAVTLQFAQVHATLALAAATFDTSPVLARHSDAWNRATRAPATDVPSCSHCGSTGTELFMLDLGPLNLGRPSPDPRVPAGEERVVCVDRSACLRRVEQGPRA